MLSDDGEPLSFVATLVDDCAICGLHSPYAFLPSVFSNLTCFSLNNTIKIMHNTKRHIPFSCQHT